MKNERNIVTKHFRNDRADRATYIAQTVGFGEVVKETMRNNTATIEQVTETGVIIVRNLNTAIITMYIGQMNQIAAIYGDKRVPMWLVNKIKKNVKYAKKQPC